MNKKLIFLGVIFIVGLFLAFWGRNPFKRGFAPSEPPVVSAFGTAERAPSPSPAKAKKPRLKNKKEQKNEATSEEVDKDVIELNEYNFSSNVNQCLNGYACELLEDPWALYQAFKREGKLNYIDDLVIFLRTKIGEDLHRDRYKAVLLKMIRDFYPPEDVQFQEAAYYEALGEHQKALENYLAVRKGDGGSTALGSGVDLAIANILFDMGRFSEALEYYESALRVYVNKTEDSPYLQETIRFIRERIEEAKKNS